MDRNIKTQAIVIRTARYGELHKIVTLMSRELGVVQAVVYGGRKGRRTALAPLFSIGEFQLYNNPTKKEYSIEEGVSSFIPTNISNDLESTYAASLMCELAMKTASDDPEPMFELLRDALLYLDGIEPQMHERSPKRAVVAFLWKMLQVSGLAPDLDRCPNCDHRYEDDEVLSFSTTILAPTCSACADTQQLLLPPGARRYLRYTMSMDYGQAADVKLNPAAEARILGYLTKWTKLHVNAPIRTLESWPF